MSTGRGTTFVIGLRRKIGKLTLLRSTPRRGRSASDIEKSQQKITTNVRKKGARVMSDNEKTLRLKTERTTSQLEIDSFAGREDDKVSAIKQSLASEMMRAIVSVGIDDFGCAFSFSAFDCFDVDPETQSPKKIGVTWRLTADIVFSGDDE